MPTITRIASFEKYLISPLNGVWRSSLLLCVILFLLAARANLANAQDDEILHIKKQISELLIATPPEKDLRFTGKESGKSDIEEWMRSIAADGSWPDISYESRTTGAWQPLLHLARLKEMSLAYVTPSNTLHGDPSLRKAIHSALGNWLEKDYRSFNWFHNDIRVPQYMAHYMFILDSDVSPEERAKALKIISRSSITMTGQNRVWLAGNVLMRGVLEGNSSLVKKGRDAINEEIVYSETDGLQIDNSFQQHGPQLQLGSYGLAFARDVSAWMEYLRGTSMAFDKDKIEMLRNYILYGEYWTSWKGFKDISACGRQLFPSTQSSKGEEASRLLRSLEKIDASSASICQKALLSFDGVAGAKEQITGNRMFWRSDFMVDRRPGYYASVRLNSERTRGSESINKENIFGGFLADGSLYIYQSGREYEDIFPVWNWRKIPGITCIDKASIAPSAVQKRRNAGTFVGGVSDGVDGAAVMDYHIEEMSSARSRRSMDFKARKSWFFFDGRIVALGAGISTEFDTQKDGAITTTINQCLLKGPVLAASAENTTAIKGRQSLTDLQWALHDSVGYLLLQPACVTLGGEEQKGSWKNVYEAASPDPVAKEIFSIWIDHESQPKDATYAYMILPSVSEEQMKKYSKSPGVEIIQNTSDMQAVRCGNTAIAVFYKPGQFNYAPDRQISVDQPSLLMIKNIDKEPKLTVSDPTQKLKELLVTCNGKSSKVQLPVGQKAGSSIEAR